MSISLEWISGLDITTGYFAAPIQAGNNVGGGGWAKAKHQSAGGGWSWTAKHVSLGLGMWKPAKGMNLLPLLNSVKISYTILQIS